MEHILAIGKLPTDDRDRPLSPVTIPHCGELELRKPPPKKRSPSPSPRRSASPRRADRGSDSESDDSRRRKEKSRRREKKESRSKNKKPRGAREAREETLDELDARLEREEKERLEAERLERVEEQKREIERERIRAKESGDVVYKGECAAARLQSLGWDVDRIQVEGQCDIWTQSRYGRRGYRRITMRDSRTPGPGGAEATEWSEVTEAT